MAEDYFSTHGLLKQYILLTDEKINEVKIIYDKAMQEDAVAKKIFEIFGGSIISICIFSEKIREELNENHLSVNVIISEVGEKVAIRAAASLIKNKSNDI